MKNNFTLYLLIFIFSIVQITNKCFAEEIKFEADNIELINDDIIRASKNIIIKDNLGTEIYGDKILINKKEGSYTITDNVIFIDNQNILEIKTEKVIYDKFKNIVTTFNKTNIIKNNKYFVETSNIKFNRNKNIIFTKEKAIFNDLENNKFNTESFEIILNKNLFKSNNAIFTDKELNIYNIKNLLFDYENNKLLGKDVAVNKDNKVSKKKNLPRIKSNSLIIENDISSFGKTVYTNCKKREGCPPWLLQAKRVEHNKIKKQLKYDNALLKIYDVPVFYFPKFFHPDPTVERQSGFLTPTVSTTNSNSFIKLPYFFEISSNSDLTLSPRFYDNQKNIFQGEYRLVTEKSDHIFDASIQNEEKLISKNESKTHFFSKSLIEMDLSYFDESKIDFQMQSTSNDTYLKSDNLTSPIISSQSTLSSKLNFTGNTNTVDFEISTEIYEDLTEENDSDKYEYIFPNFNLTKDFETSLSGSLSMNNIGYNKIYDTNINEKVLVNNLTYKSLDSINNYGMINNYEFLIKNFNADSKNSKNLKNKNEHNIQGIFQFNTKFPLQKTGYKYNSSLTPIFVAKFNPLKNKDIKNTDRIIDYNNIYSINRIASNETLEGKNSITIGNEYKLFSNDNKNSEIFGFNLATSFRDQRNEDLPTKSSLGQTASNIVGQVNLKTNEFIDLSYDFISDNNLNQFNYHKIDTTFKINNFVSTFEFIEESNKIGDESFFANETSYFINENKNLKFRTRKNKKTDLTEYYNLIYQYKMDCLTAGIEYKKNYYSDGDIKPEESLYFSITLMPFGGSISLPGLN